MVVAELLLGFRWVLGAVFVTTGITKLRAGGLFEQSLASYRIFPGFSHRPLARALPIVEIGLGAACVLGIVPALAGWSSCVLLLAFACAVAWNLSRGRRFECGCGTIGDRAISWSLVLRDLGLAAIAAAVALGPSGSLALWRGSSALSAHPPVTAELVPVPMIAILLAAAMRTLALSRSVPTDHPRPAGSGGGRGAHLPLVRSSEPASGAVKAR